MKFTKPKVKEKCSKCKAKWKGDGWTMNCPNCGANQGNR
jgi:Zn finger protein HypA/HybF involved in hydrogenase expression